MFVNVRSPDNFRLSWAPGLSPETFGEPGRAFAPPVFPSGEGVLPPGVFLFPGGLCPPHYTCSSNRTKADIILFFILVIYIYDLS